MADPSVFVRLPLTSGPLAGKAALLVWTTTPWTLVSNALVAAHRDVTVRRRHRRSSKSWWSPSHCWSPRSATGWTVTERFAGTELAGWTYQRPFELAEWPDDHAHFVVLEDYVTTEDGTGLVHQSPAHGADDFRSCRENGVAMVNLIDTTGRFLPELDLVGGEFFKKADPNWSPISRSGGCCSGTSPTSTPYPHCWRCHTPVIYYALPAWYIRTTRIQDALLAREREDQLVPRLDQVRAGTATGCATTSTGRCRGPLLGDPAADLALRGRPPGLRRIAGRAERAGRTGPVRDRPAPPYVDDVTFACPTCGSRVAPGRRT